MAALDTIPIPVVFAILVGEAILTVEGGYLLGGWYRREQGLNKYPLESAAANTVLGLLAFLLAFSFGSTAGRYQDLVELARLDNDAISDVYLMSDFLPDDSGSKVRQLVREYHTIRVEAIRSRDHEHLAETLARSKVIQSELWDLAVAVRQADSDSILNQFVGAVDGLMDSHQARVEKGLVTRVPAIIWFTLGTLLLIASLLLGFAAGLHGRRSRFSSTIVIVAFSAVLMMIVDLDRPFRSLFRSAGDPVAEAMLEEMKADAIQEMEMAPES